MNVELECIAGLEKIGDCRFTDSTSYTLAQGQTVADLVAHAKLPVQEIECIIVNNAIGSLNTVLSEGDKVDLVPVFGFG